MTESLTQTEAAERLGIHPRTLRKHTNDGRVPRNDDRSYPWPEVRDAYLELKAEEAAHRASGFGDDSYEAARARKTAAQARMAELAVLEKERRLIPADEVERLLAEPLEQVNLALKGSVSQYAPELAKVAGIPLAQAKAILGDIIEHVRADLRGVPNHAA